LVLVYAVRATHSSPLLAKLFIGWNLYMIKEVKD
jgi:hypothetical protein